MRKFLLSLAFPFLVGCPAWAQQLAFPGAEGYGAYATGGRGCQIVHVTNLNASGSGSLADAVSKPNRFVVFDVGGVIDITGNSITIASNITIAGQTAPGEGITIYGGRVIASNAKNVILRYLRMRGGKSVNSSKCTLTLDYCENLIMDHCSVSWGPWDNVHIKDANNITWQYCINSEGIEPQRFGSITDGTRNWTISHCLWADNKSRNPKMKCYVQYYNNVVYNYGMGIIGGHSAADNYQDVMNNYFIAGPNGSAKYFDDWTATDHLYSSGNYFDGNCDGMLNGTLITDHHQATAMSQKNFNTTHPMNLQTAEDAYSSIVEQVGASRVRDVHDKRIIEQLTSLGKKGAFIASEDDVRGIGSVAGGARPKDTDNDGMPDEWESANGLNPMKDDANEYTLGGGYTNIEHYVNSLAQKTEINPLQVAISSAQGVAETAAIDVTNGYSSAALATLMDAIAAAQKFYDESGNDATETQLDSAAAVLNKAVTTFQESRITTFMGYSTDYCYNIYSYGTHSGASTANADRNTQRRYLYTIKSKDGQRDSLVYRIGLTDNDISGGKSDAIAKNPAALWAIEDAGNGYVYIRSQKVGSYLQIERLLSANSVAVYPLYAKDDNGKNAFYMDADETGKRLFNVGAPDSNGKGGPLEFFSVHADRTRLRWVFEVTKVKVNLPNTVFQPSAMPSMTSSSMRYYSLDGQQLSRPPRTGIFFKQQTTADGHVNVHKLVR
ncbi:MAG: hypothetical protein IKO85_02745 [Bacteroidaceae bacterium]|nr:hypothetical protein [Bacteroidaceae bacterium]